MTDTNHNDTPETFEDGLNRVAFYRGVQLCITSITRKQPNVTHDDGTITGASYALACLPSKLVKKLVDAYLDAPGVTQPPAPPPAEPPTPPPPPAPAPPALTVPTGQTLTADKTTVMVGDHVNVTAVLNFEGAPSKPVTAMAFSWDRTKLDAPNNWTPRFLAIAPGVVKLSNSNSGTVGRVEITVIPNDGTVFPPDPPAPPPAAPAPPPASGGPPAPGGAGPLPSIYPDPPPAGEVGDSAHAVVATVTDRGTKEVWRAVAHTGEDRQAPCMMVSLVNDQGAAHPALMLQAYADKCHVHVARMDNPYDYLGFDLQVTFDGQPADVPPPSNEDGSYDFWKGCWHPYIAYGAQEPFNPANVDRSMFPRFAAKSQKPIDISKFKFTWNGLGGTNMPKMGTTGERNEIGPLQVAYITFWLEPTAENWAIVQLIERYCTNWSNVFVCEPSTGGIIRYTDYPMATVLSAAQSAAYAASNPVAAYGGSWRAGVLTPPASFWENGGSPYEPNTAHLTSYGTLAAMITRTAHDRDLLSFWANYCCIDQGPTYTRQQGFIVCAQRRTAWAARSMFVACYYSADTDYFNAEFDRNLAIANAWPKNDLGIVDTHLGYAGKGGADGYTGYAQWMQSYEAIEFAVVAAKRPEWLDWARYCCKLYAVAHKYPFVMCLGVYGLIIQDPAGHPLTDLAEIMRLSLENNGWTEELALQAVNAKTVEECYAAVIADSTMGGKPAWAGKCVAGVADYIGYLNSPSSYPATIIAAVESGAWIGTPDIEDAVHYVRNQPTPIQYAALGIEKYHIEQAPAA